jgi:hypothetical protein
MMKMDTIIRHFEEFSLTEGDMAGVVLCTAAFYIVLVGFCRTLIFNRKKLAFCLSMVNSFLMVLFGLTYLAIKSIKLGHNLFDFYGGELQWWAGRDNFSVVVMLMFGTTSIMDLALGWVYYREHLYLLTTWIHHIVYIWLMGLLITGDGYFVSLPSPYTPAFMCALIEELPTFILALGTVFPQCRQDLAFGVTFCLTRLMLHAYMLVYMIRLGAPWLVIGCYVNPLLLHLHWFYTWCSKYGFDKKKKTKSKEKEL